MLLYFRHFSCKYILPVIIFICFLSIASFAIHKENINGNEQNNKSKLKEDQPWSVRIAQSFVQRHPGSVTYDEYMTFTGWNYQQGVMLEAMRQMWEYTGGSEYFNFIKENIEQYVGTDGSIKTYSYEEFNLDNIAAGRALLFLYERTKETKYKIAADTLRKQLLRQPRTKEGGFWHKKIYPYQMWLDGLYMAQPFYAQYSLMFDEDKNSDDIFLQFASVYNHTLDKETGLLYHAWNENKEQKWADKETGRSPHIWGRAIGWYLMAIVDVLDFIKEEDDRRKDLIKTLQDVSEALLKYRDEKTGLWYQVLDMGTREDNYLEASCATMFSYVFAKGANKGYLDKKFLDIAEESFNSIMKVHGEVDESGYINLYNTCRGAGLGGNPYRDGSYEYYIGESIRTNDFKGYGPLIFTAIELEKAGLIQHQKLGKKTLR